MQSLFLMTGSEFFPQINTIQLWIEIDDISINNGFFICIILIGQPDKKAKCSHFSGLHQFEAIRMKMLCKHSSVVYIKVIILYIST